MNDLVRQGMRFGSVGVVNTLAGLAVIFAAMHQGASPALANALGYGVGLSFGFVMHRKWTFRAGGPVARQGSGYVVVAGASYAMNLVAVLILTREAHVNPYAAQCAGVAIYTVCTFVGFRYLVFRSPSTTSRAARPLRPRR